MKVKVPVLPGEIYGEPVEFIVTEYITSNGAVYIWVDGAPCNAIGLPTKSGRSIQETCWQMAVGSSGIISEGDDHRKCLQLSQV